MAAAGTQTTTGSVNESGNVNEGVNGIVSRSEKRSGLGTRTGAGAAPLPHRRRQLLLAGPKSQPPHPPMQPLQQKQRQQQQRGLELLQRLTSFWPSKPWWRWVGAGSWDWWCAGLQHSHPQGASSIATLSTLSSRHLSTRRGASPQC